MGVEEVDEFELQKGTSTLWLVTFGILFLIVLSVALLLYMLLIRSLALSRRKVNPTLLTVVFIFGTFLVDLGLVMEELFSLAGIYVFTTPNCRLVTYTIYGNRILQTLLVMFLLYYNVVASLVKTYRFETLAVKFYPLIVLSILFIEFIMTIAPVTGVRMHKKLPACEYTSSSGVQRLNGWMYNVVLPYWLPLLVCLPPVIYLANRFKQEHFIEPRKTQVKLSIAISVAYFLFLFLHYMLMLAREVEILIVEKTELQQILGTHVWYITRPMFMLIGHGWHIAVPLICLLQDKELYQHLPKRPRKDGDMGLEEAAAEDSEDKTDRNKNKSRSHLETNEYHNSAAADVVCIG